MKNADEYLVYKDIKERTGGEIYIGDGGIVEPTQYISKIDKYEISDIIIACRGRFSICNINMVGLKNKLKREA